MKIPASSSSLSTTYIACKTDKKQGSMKDPSAEPLKAREARRLMYAQWKQMMDEAAQLPQALLETCTLDRRSSQRFIYFGGVVNVIVGHFPFSTLQRIILECFYLLGADLLFLHSHYPGQLVDFEPLDFYWKERKG
jgi:hypothetical protein